MKYLSKGYLANCLHLILWDEIKNSLWMGGFSSI
jgi:hypothetical protein